LAENEVPSEKKEGKGLGCSRLAQAGLAVLVLIMLWQLLMAVGDNFGSFATLCCIGVTLIVILVAFTVFQGLQKKAEAQRSEHQFTQTLEAQTFFRQGGQLLSQGRREEAVAAYLQAYREGGPDVRKKALTALKNLGEIEEF
jgi:hypothetical protein